MTLADLETAGAGAEEREGGVRETLALPLGLEGGAEGRGEPELEDAEGRAGADEAGRGPAEEAAGGGREAEELAGRPLDPMAI